MIAFVRGRVATVSLSSAVVEVGGVGLELLCTPATLASLRPGADSVLQTSMVVREDSMTLFGFATDDEKQVFELAQSASGVGPKVAQSLLAVLSPDEFRAAVAGEDVRTLTKVPGIGPKGAQRIILELKDRIGAPAAAVLAGTGGSPQWRDQVHQGLVGLGYGAKDADKAIDVVADSGVETADVGSLLRAALAVLRKS